MSGEIPNVGVGALQQLLAGVLRDQFGREPTPKEIAAALELRQRSIAEYTSSSAARIASAMDANKPSYAGPTFSRSELPVDHLLHVNACKSPALWIEPRRPEPRPTVEKINKRNFAEWKKWNAQHAAFEERHPERAKKVGQRTAHLIQGGRINDPELAAETSYVGKIIELAEVLADEQSVRAKQPRPRKKTTHRSLVIAQMKKFRAAGHKLKEFTKTDHDGLTIKEEVSKRGVTRYVVVSGELRGKNNRAIEKSVAKSTLGEWWMAARTDRGARRVRGVQLRTIQKNDAERG